MQEWLAQYGLGEATITMVVSYGVKLLGVLFVLWLGFFAGNKVQRLISRKLGEKIDISLARFLGNVVRWLIVILAILGCLSIFGIETTSFAAIIGGASVAIGLAFQGSLSNVAAGIMLLIFRPFKVGDVIAVSGTTGKVDEISLFVTTLDTPDQRRFIVPNSQIFGSTIENVTFHPERRVDVNVGIDYTADIDSARAVLREAAARIPGIVGDPTVVLTGLGTSSVDFQVRVVVPTDTYWDVRDALIRECKYALDKENIGIPYPHVIVTQKAS